MLAYLDDIFVVNFWKQTKRRRLTTRRPKPARRKLARNACDPRPDSGGSLKMTGPGEGLDSGPPLASLPKKQHNTLLHECHQR